MNLIQDVLSAASTQPEQDHFARIKLADILPDPENFYETDGIEELAAAIDAFGLEPVSYTHLDVYKRQAMGVAEFASELE